MCVYINKIYSFARKIVRSNSKVYQIVRTVKYGPYMGIRDLRQRRSLLRQARNEGWLVLNIGSGGRKLDYGINLDVSAIAGPDVVGDGHHLPFPNGIFDAIFCEYVVEHIPDPEKFLGTVSNSLTLDGIFYLEIPFLQPLHIDKCDYTRWTRNGFVLAAERSGLKVINSGIHLGPAFTLFWILKEWGAMLLSFGVSSVFQIVRYLLSWMLSPILLLDLLMLRLPQAEILSNGFFVVAKLNNKENFLSPK